MDKRKPTHSLSAFQAAFAATPSLMSLTATKQAAELGYTVAQAQALVARLTFKQFYKSTLSLTSNHIWHDVYHVTDRGVVVYIKFVRDPDGSFALLSFKER